VPASKPAEKPLTQFSQLLKEAEAASPKPIKPAHSAAASAKPSDRVHLQIADRHQDRALSEASYASIDESSYPPEEPNFIETFRRNYAKKHQHHERHH